jgi:hypothetical protein
MHKPYHSSSAIPTGGSLRSGGGADASAEVVCVTLVVALLFLIARIAISW